MSKICQVTGKKTPMSGNNVSKAINKTRRRFMPNLHKHKFWVESENKFVSLNVSAKEIKNTLDKKGIDTVLSEIRARGEKNMREKIKLVSSAGTGHYYTTDKNKTNTPDKIEIKKFDPVVRKHVIYKEDKIK